MNRNLNERFMKRLANEAPLGDTMAAKYQRAKTFDSLANDCEEIRLEALCRHGRARSHLQAPERRQAGRTVTTRPISR